MTAASLIGERNHSRRGTARGHKQRRRVDASLGHDIEQHPSLEIVADCAQRGDMQSQIARRQNRTAGAARFEKQRRRHLMLVGRNRQTHIQQNIDDQVANCDETFSHQLPICG